jgi:hypothetical protein
MVPISSDPRTALKDRVRRVFAEYSGSATEAMERELTVNKRLNESERRVSDAVRRLTEDGKRAEMNCKAFEGRSGEIEKWLQGTRGAEGVDPDEAVKGGKAVYQQYVFYAAHIVSARLSLTSLAPE